MEFSKLLFKTLFDNIPDWVENTTENCYQPCLNYKTPICKNLPKYMPQQFPPYYDDIDPNSVRKYREQPQCIETFEITPSNNNNLLLISILIMLMCIYIIFHLEW